jgi:lipopolysaccharide export system protein LptA
MTAMAASPQVRRLQRVRYLLLAALGISIAGIAGLYLFGRAGREPPAVEGSGGADPGVALAGEGFDYTLTQGDTKIFRIRGDQIRSDRNDNVELEGVALTFYAEGGKEYNLHGKGAVYNRQTHNAHIEGPVKLSGPGGVALETAALSLDRGGRQLLSNAPVTFRVGEQLHGKARELRAMLPREIFMLVGGVEVNSAGGAGAVPLRLRAKRVVFERKDRMLRAEGDVELRRGGSTVTAQRLSAELSADEKRLQSMQARWQVRGALRREAVDAANSDTPLPAGAEISGERLAVLFTEASEVSRIELEGDGGSAASLKTKDGGGETRSLQAPRVIAELAEGVLQRAEASGGTRIETLAGGATRTATAATAQAFFDPQGNLATVTLEKGVTVNDASVSASGDRAVLDERAGRAELFGKDARARSPRGELLAPHIIWTRATALVHADGGVRATLDQKEGGGFTATPLGGEGPVRVEAREANWQEVPPTYSFVGAVRAWRGDNLLVTEQLRGSEADGQMAASGGVETTWVPEPRPGETPQEPIEVRAPTLVYRRSERYASYAGGVRITQQKRVVTCQEAKVTLDDRNRAQHVACTGDVLVDDPPMNRRVEGDRAEYDVAGQQITVFGEPVTLSDLQRGKAQGRQLVYDIEKGTIRLLSVAEAGGQS